MHRNDKASVCTHGRPKLATYCSSSRPKRACEWSGGISGLQHQGPEIPPLRSQARFGQGDIRGVASAVARGDIRGVASSGTRDEELLVGSTILIRAVCSSSLWSYGRADSTVPRFTPNRDGSLRRRSLMVRMVRSDCSRRCCWCWQGQQPGARLGRPGPASP